MFARAAARQHAHAPPPDGLTLDELQEIGREAGLDPAHIAAVVAESDTEAETQQTWHGVPVGVTRTRLLPDRVSDAEWERIVDVLRAHYKMPGTAQQIGRREWTTAAGSTMAYRVTVEPRDNGDLVRVEAPASARSAGILIGLGLSAAAIVMFLSTALTTGELAGPALASAPFAAFGALFYLSVLAMARFAAPREAARHDALLDRIDLLSRADAAVASSTAASSTAGPAPALDLDELADAPDAEARATRRRDRA